MIYFSKDLIFCDYFAFDKEDLLQKLAKEMYQKGFVNSYDEYYDAIMQRENIISTGVGREIALPHGRTEAAKELKVLVCILRNKLEYNSLDKKPVKIVFMLAAPLEVKTKYMKLLGKISQFLSKQENFDKITEINDINKIYEILRGIENEI